MATMLLRRLSAPAFARNSLVRQSSTLPKILKRELKLDLESGSADMPEDLAELKKVVEESMKLTDISGMSVVTLESTLKGVVISFDIRDIVPDQGFDNEFDEGENQPKEGEENEEEEGIAIPFVADIKKNEDILRFRCTATETINIDSVEFLTKGDLDDKLYTGPEFHELDPDLQDAFAEYLSNAGVDDTVGSFIAMYADFKEQQEYTSWLKKVEGFSLAK